MFKKPPHKIFTSSALRGSDVKILRQRVIALFPAAEAVVDELVPKGIVSCKFDTHLDETGVLYSSTDKEPLWFAMGKGAIAQSNLVPTGGADLMIPGVVPSPIIPSLTQGQLVAITQYRSTTPLVVGSMAINGSELKDDEDQKGKAVVTLHATGDALWALGSKAEPPEGRQEVQVEGDGVAEVAEGVEGIKIEDGSAPVEETSTPASAESRLPTAQEIETTLRATTLFALAKLEPSTFPMPASTFYSSHILPSRPARPVLPSPSAETDVPLDPQTFLSHLDIKHTPQKKLAPFLKALEKDGIIKLKEVRGELLVFSVDMGHPALEEAKKWGWKTVGAEEKKEKEREKENAGGEQGKGKEIIIEEVWFPEGNATGFFEACGESAPNYTLAALRPLLTKYVTSHNLQHPSNPKFVVLDDILSRALTRKGEEGKEFVERGELVERLCGNMKAMWRVGGTGGFKKGTLPHITVQTKIRQGRKVVTLITGFEVFGLDQESLSEELRKRCASSTTVAPCPEKPKQLEVMVQGSQVKAVTDLLLELGVPKKWIAVSEKAGKGKGGKATLGILSSPTTLTIMAGAGNQGFLKRAHTFMIYLGGLYAGFIILLLTPGFQRHAIYMHAVRFPRNAKYDTPELYGLAPGKTLNLNITTSDDVRLGAWFVAAEGFYQKHLKLQPPVESGFDTLDDERYTLASLLPDALSTYPTVLFLHGNAMTRAFSLRTRLYSTITSRLNANVLAIDYRGFGDSEGTPSEQGLYLDARAAWDWLVENGANEGDITVVGQSLGTGVSAGLAAELVEEGISPRGIVLLAPYSSIATLLETYNLGGRLPILQPLQKFKFVFPFIMKFLRHRFNTLSDIKCPITIIHATDDWDIPVAHSQVLFDSLLESLLPAIPFDTQDVLTGKVSHEEFSKSINERKARRDELITTREVNGLGKISSFSREGDVGSVTFLETTWGEHNGIGAIEGVIDVMGWSVGRG